MFLGIVVLIFSSFDSLSFCSSISTTCDVNLLIFLKSGIQCSLNQHKAMNYLHEHYIAHACADGHYILDQQEHNQRDEIIGISPGFLWPNSGLWFPPALFG